MRQFRAFLIFCVMALAVMALRPESSSANNLRRGALARAAAFAQTPESSSAVGTTNCRIGVSVGGGDAVAQRDWIPTFRVGWFLSFSVGAGNIPSNVEFTPMVAIKQPKTPGGAYLPGYIINYPLTAEGLGQQIAENPGALWIVGNEVDRTGQGDIFPRNYATAYHDVYHFIKQNVATAQVTPSGLVQVTPGRLQYLDIVWETYRERYGTIMPVDAWTMHLYILPEVNPQGEPNGIASIALGTDPALGRRESGGNASLCPLEDVYCFAEHDDMDVFARQVVDMRRWMRDHGYLDKPLLISEYSLLYPYVINPGSCFLQDEFGGCFTPDRVSNFVRDSFDYLENAAVPGLGMPDDNNRLVQQWLWFSLNTDAAGEVSDLVNDELTGLTQVGTVFRNEVLARPLQVNLIPERASSPVVFTNSGTGTATATLSLHVRNNGNTYVNRSFLVSFFNADTNSFIGAATIPALDGCARRTQKVEVLWPDLPPGVHDYYARVDSVNVIPESNEGDNLIYGTVLVDPASHLFLPTSARSLQP